MRLTVPGAPIAKKRPRFARKGRYVMAYNDQQTEEGRFLLEIYRQYNGKPIPDSALMLDVTFFMPIPSSASKKKQQLMAKQQIAHIKKPDLDNLVKFVKDCCNGVIWKDDSQIDYLTARKIYGPEPQTLIVVQWGKD